MDSADELGLEDERVSLRSAAGLIALQQLPGVEHLVAKRIALACNDFDPHLEDLARLWEEATVKARDEIKRCREMEISVVSIFDPSYPPRLLTVKSPPAVLYVRGNVDALGHARTVVVAGTKTPTPVGTAATERIASTLAGSGWTVAGSLVSGVETIARRAAHARGVPTVAVVGGGLPTAIRPSKEKLVAEIIAGGGAVVSPHALEKRGGGRAEVEGRRVASGLAVAVVVTDALLTDFAMHTVHQAALQQRPLFCVAPPPRVQGDGEEGLEVLLEMPAWELSEKMWVWKRMGPKAALSGEAPLAQAAPVDPVELTAGLERILDTEHRDPPSPNWWPEVWRPQNTPRSLGRTS